MSDKEEKLIKEIKNEYQQYQNMNQLEKAMYIGMYVKGKIDNLKATATT